MEHVKQHTRMTHNPEKYETQNFHNHILMEKTITLANLCNIEKCIITQNIKIKKFWACNQEIASWAFKQTHCVSLTPTTS